MTNEELGRVKRAVIRKYPISAGLALQGIKIDFSNSTSTAEVVAEKMESGILKVKEIEINPEFFDKLTFSERVFVLAHEACHVALKHFSRALDKPEKDAERKYNEYCQKETNEQKREQMKAVIYKRYHNIWNIATDACINAFLKKDGLSFPKNVIDPETGKKMEFVDIEDGLYKSAEKIYDYLVKKEEEKEQKKENNGSNSSDPKEDDQSQQANDEQSNDSKNAEQKNSSSMGNLDNVDIDNYKGFDSHEEWTGDRSQQNNNQASDESEKEESINEEEVFKKELESRQKKEKPTLKESFSKVRSGVGLDNYVPVKPVISWKRLLVGILEKTEEVWGTRRASRFNPNARIEERTFEKLPSVEVILDTSGSISTSLLRGFLMQLCPLFEEIYGDETRIKVGCFGDEFYGFHEIRTQQDILNFKPTISGGTNFEVAATSFTKGPTQQITKIVFTDGCLGIPQTTRVNDIIWIVFGDRMDFTPVGGRIIKVNSNEYKNMENFGYISINNIEDSKGFSR